MEIAVCMVSVHEALPGLKCFVDLGVIFFFCSSPNLLVLVHHSSVLSQHLEAVPKCLTVLSGAGS